MYGKIANYLINDGAKAVVFDIIFSGPDMDRGEGETLGSESDEEFYNAMKNTGKVILPFNIDNRYEKNDELNTLMMNNPQKLGNIKEYKYLYAPYQLFTTDNKNFGFVDIDAESDGLVREYRPLVKIKDKYYPSLALATYILTSNNEIGKDFALNKKGNFKLKWYGPGGNTILDEKGKVIKQTTFDYYSAWYIFVASYKSEKGLETQIPKGTFKNKVVFIGSSARGLLDQKNTPFSIGGNAYPGLEIHATAYLNLINKDWIKNINIVIEFLFYFIIIFFLIFVGINAKSLLKYSFVFGILLIVISLFSYLLFRFYNIQTQLIFYLLLLLFSYILTLIVNYVIVGHNRNVIKNAFGTYLSPDLVKKISDTDKPIATSGEDINASALFIDIQGFTTFSEKNPPETVVEVLNLYLKAFSEIIMNNKGFVNKFLGDGLMALFGAPDNFSEHADMAVKSAFECYKANNELTKDYGLNVRIGVNSGKMIVGNMGGGKRLEYTAIGDNVNLASRLEGANKFFNTRIILGENTFNLLKNNYDFNYLGRFSVKGKDIPIGIYYYTADEKLIKEQFYKMITAYESKNLEEFEKMRDFFKNEASDFGPASFYENYYIEHEDKFGEPIKLTEK